MEVPGYWQEGSEFTGSTGVLQGSSLSSSTEGRSSHSAFWSPSCTPTSEMIEGLKPGCRMCARDEEEESVFITPCRCNDKLSRRFCLEESFSRSRGGPSFLSCGASHPLCCEAKPIWCWFLEPELQAAATLFIAYMTLGAGTILALLAAWLYVLFESPSSPWLPALLASLLVFSIFWIAFGCLCFQRL